jgi:PAS domain S-box-containing protein
MKDKVRAKELSNSRLKNSLDRADSQQLKSEEELRTASFYSRSLIEASLDPLVTISPEGKITDVNKATELVTGRSREQLIGTDFFIYFTEPEKARNGYQQVLKEGIVRDYPLAIRHTSGRITEVLYNASIYKDQDGELLGVFAAARDITELKKTEQIKRQRSILERTNQGLREAIMSETVEEVASKCLALGEELTGSKFGLIGEVNQVGRFDCIALSNPGWDACRISHSDAVKLIKNMEIRGLWAKVIKDEHSQIVNDPSSHPDRAGIPEGHPPLTSFLGVPLKHAGRTIGMIALANKESGYDVDDQEIIETLSRAFGEVLLRKRSEEVIRRLNEDLKRRNLELEAINKELEAFSYSVSHDLRAPLRGIDGFSRALLEDYGDKLDQQGKDHLQRVRFASQRMGEIIEGMLNLSQVTRTPLHQQVIDLSAGARSIAAQLQEKQPKRQVEFVIAEGVMGNGDRRLLEVVLENLLSNAWKFTEKHPRARIEFGVTQKEGESVYFVRDDGAGFDMGYVDKLFGAFQRLHSGDEFEGTGIGLATVQRIIHRHGGRIWAEGGVEKGATFYFTLPLVNEPITTETINQEGIYGQQVCPVSGRQ